MDLSRIEGAFKPTRRKRAVSSNGMVAAAFPEATRAGAEMLEAGGNAVDAACACALALGVCEPQGSGLGGQTVALLHFGGRTVAIDGSSHAPALAHPSRIRSEISRANGYKAATIPTTLAVIAYLNARYGTLEWPRLFEPAIRIARDGYLITKLQRAIQTRELANFLRVPSRSGARYFLKNGEVPYDVGDLFIQRELAKTLDLVARCGVEIFYRGEIAERIDADMRAHRGLLRADDLALIPEVIERKPVEGSYRGFVLRSFPPPGSGHTLLRIFSLMEERPSEFFAQASPESFCAVAEILREAFIENRAGPLNPNTYRPPKLGETTHVSVMDQAGNAVGLTQSINLVYGAKAAAEGLGFLYNNYVEAFQYGKPEHYYNLRPGGIPWASAAPTIVFCDDEPWIVLGSPGSQRIYSSIAQFLSGLLDRELPMSDAVARPRLHAEEDGEVSLELDRFDPEVPDGLQSRGFRICRREPYSFYLGAIHAVLRRRTDHGFQGVADVRRDGSAMGPRVMF